MNSSFYVDIEKKTRENRMKYWKRKRNIARVSQSALISEFASHSNSLHLIHSGFAHFKRDDVDHSWHGGFAIKIESDHKWAQIMRFHCFQMFPIFYPFILFETISLARQNSSQFDCAIVTLLLYISCIGSEKVTSLSLL